MYLTVSGVNITPTVFPGTPIWALKETHKHIQKVTISLELHTHTCELTEQLTWRRRGCSLCRSAAPCPQSGEWGWWLRGCSTHGWARSVQWYQSLWHTWGEKARCWNLFHYDLNFKGDLLCFLEQVMTGLWVEQNMFFTFFCTKSFLENKVIVWSVLPILRYFRVFCHFKSK